MSRVSALPHLPPGAYLEAVRHTANITSFSSLPAVAVTGLTECRLRHLPVTAELAGRLLRERAVTVHYWAGELRADIEITAGELNRIAGGADPYAVLTGPQPLMVVAKQEA